MANPVLGVDLEVNDRASPTLKVFESGVIRTVGAVSAALTALATIGFPVMAASAFQKQMLNVRKTTDLSHEAITSLGQGLVELSKQTNKTAVDLAKIAEMGGRMGVADMGTPALLDFVKQVSTLSTALDLEADQVATAMGKLVNIFGLATDEFQKAGAVINSLDNASTATAEEIFDIMRRIGNLGGSASFQQAATLSALAVDLGLTAETAGTTITKIFADMKSEAAKFAQFMGVSTEQWVKIVDRNAMEALRMFVDTLNKLPTEVASAAKVQLTGGGRIFEYMTKMQNQMRLGDGSRWMALDKVSIQSWKDGTSAQKEQQAVLSGLSAQWDVFLNKVNSVAIQVGEKSLYGLTLGLQRVGDALSNQASVDGMVSVVTRTVDAITYMADTFATVASRVSVSWDAMFDLAKLLLITKTVSALRSLSGSIRLPKLPEQSIRSQYASAIGQAKEAGNLRAVTVLEREQAIVAGVSAAYQRARDALEAWRERREAATRAAAAQQAAVQAEMVAMARLGDAQRAAGAYNVDAMNARVASATRRRDAAQARVDASVPDTAAAEAYITQRIAEQQARRVALQEAHEAQLRAIRGRGAVARREALTAEQAAETTRLNRVLAKQMQGYTSHYAYLVTQATTYADTVRRTNENLLRHTELTLAAMQQARTKLAAAESGARLADTTETLQRAAANRARANIAPDVVTGPTTRLMLALTGAVNSASTANGVFRLSAFGARDAISLMGTAASAATKGVGMLSVGFLRIVPIVGQALFIFEMVKMALDAFGATDWVVAKLNSLLDVFSKLTGVKVSAIGSAAKDADAAAAKAAELTRNIQEATMAAEKFSAVFSALDANAGADAMSAQVAGFENAIRRRVDSYRAGITRDVTSGFDPLQVVKAATSDVVLLNAKMMQTNMLLDVARKASIESRTQQNTAEADLAKAKKELADAEAALGARNSQPLSIRDNPIEKLLGGQEDAAYRVSQAVKAVEDAQDRVNQKAQGTTVLLDREIALTRQYGAASAAASDLIVTTVSGLDLSAWRELWGGGNEADALIAQLQKLEGAKMSAVEARDAALKQLNEAQAAKADASAINAASKNYQDLEAKLYEVQSAYNSVAKQAMETKAVIAAAPDPASRAALVSNLASMGTYRQQVAAFQQATKETNGTVYSLFQGLSSVQTKGSTTYAQLLGQMVFIDSAKKAYAAMAVTAAAAAEQAKYAVSRAMAASKQSMEEFATYAESIRRKMAEAKDAKAATAAGRTVDEGTRRQLLELDMERDRRKQILETMKETGQISERGYKRMALDIDINIDSAAQKIQDAAQLEKDKFSANQLVGRFDGAQKEAEHYLDVMRRLSEQLNNQNMPADKRAALTQPYTEASQKVAALVKQMQGIPEALAGMTDATGNSVLPQGQIEAMVATIGKFTELSGKLNVRAALPQEEVTAAYSKKMEEARGAAERSATGVAQSLQLMASASGQSIQQVAQDLASLAASPEFAKIQDNFRNMANSGAMPGFDSGQFLEGMKEAAASAAQTLGQVDMTQLRTTVEQGLASSTESFSTLLANSITKAFDTTTGDGKKPTIDAVVRIDPATAKASVAAIGVQDIAGRLVITDVVGSDGKVTKTNNIISRKDGGPVFGPGTSRSDSVMARLSHGEYVSDALTTRMFGLPFFAALKDAAVSGNPASIYRMLLPKMGSMGMGSQMLPSLSLPSVGSIRDMGTVEINFNRRPIGRVSGPKETLDGLVSALNTIARSS